MPENQVAGHSSTAALASLAGHDVKFLRSLNKAELHAHLNGSIPIDTLLDLLKQYSLSNTEPPPGAQTISREEIAETLETIKSGVPLSKLTDFFLLFTAIYALISTPQALRTATQAVLQSFLKGDDRESPQCTYLELRTTPRKTPHMTREEYLHIVLTEVNKYPNQAALIVSVDRGMSEEDLDESINLAIQLKKSGVVGIDVCGNPLKGDMQLFTKHILRAKDAGLGLTVHIAETKENTFEESQTLLSWRPDRLGHATFLSDDLKAQFFADAPQATTKLGSPPQHTTGAGENGRYQPCIEICLSSNILGKTATSLEAHHIHDYLKHSHPIAISTDDVLVFRTSCLEEYALLLAKPPLGLGLDREIVAKLAQMSMEAAFLKHRGPAEPVLGLDKYQTFQRG